MHDSATGLYTPAYLSRLVGIEVAKWKRHARPFSLVVIDMENLGDATEMTRVKGERMYFEMWLGWLSRSCGAPTS